MNPKRSFLDIVQVNDDFIIMTVCGKIYKLSNIGEYKFANVDEPMELDDTGILENITNIKLESTILTFCCVQTYDEEVFIACGSEYVYFVSSNSIDRVKYPESIKEISKIFNMENYVLGLTTSGDFVEVCPHTRTMCRVRSNQATEDFKVLESNNEYIELLVLSAAIDGERLMRVIDFPSMSCKSELNIPAVSWLVTQPKSTANMYFISGLLNENNFAQTIEIKSIVETDPDQRFKKLLLRGLFDEAEEFAKQCDLSLEPLHEARVRKSLLSLQRIKPASQAFEVKFKELMRQLTLIESKNFLVTLRLHEIPDRTSMTTFLEFILKNIDTNHYQQETNEINELLLRLETLRLIDPDDCNLKWQKFLYDQDMARVAMDYFKADVLLSCLVWSRHSSSIMPNLNLEQFNKWISNIPTTVEPFQLIQWLKHFSPCFFQLYPKEMSGLVDWCIERTRALQYSNSWPEIGLEFINSINEIFSEVKFLFVDMRRSYHNNMEKVQQMIFKLEEMAVLKKSYHLTITLDDYSKRSIEETAFRLLQRIQIQNLKRLVNDFLYPIFMERGASPEEVIVKYIQFLCTNKNLGYWQERAVASIELLHIEENRLSSALLVLKVSPVPWSNVVLPLAVLGTTSSHPLANSIYIEYKTQSIKMIKVKYQWPVDYFDLQQDRVKLVFRILKVDNPEMLDDIKTLVKSSPDIADEIFYHVMSSLVEKERIEDFADLMTHIEETSDQSRETFEKVLQAFVWKIDENDFESEDESDNVMDAAKLLVKQLSKSYDDFKAAFHDDKLKNLKNIVKVRRDFHFEIKLRNLDSSNEKTRLLEEGIAQVAFEISGHKTVDKMWSKMHLLVRTFNYNRIRCFKMLCQKLNNLYITCHVIEALSSSIDVIEKSEIGDALDLFILAIAQQIGYYDNNLKPSFDNYDPLVFPICYEFLIKALSQHDLMHHGQIIDLLKWMQIGRSSYPYDVIQATHKTRIISKDIFNSRKPIGDHLQHNKRESFSIFDTMEEKVEVNKPHDDENLNFILRCICNSLKVIIFALNASIAPYDMFTSYLSAGEDPNE